MNCQAITKINADAKWGNNCYFTYGPDPNTYGTAMRILHWFNQNDAPLGSDLQPAVSPRADAQEPLWGGHG